MPKTVGKPLVRARVDLDRKIRVEKILKQLGLSPAEAINMFYAQIELYRGLPFSATLEHVPAGFPRAFHRDQQRDILMKTHPVSGLLYDATPGNPVTKAEMDEALADFP